MRTNRAGSSNAFTRIELLAIVAVLAAFMLLQVPARAHGLAKTRALACLSNLQRLSLAWVLFANDNNDRLAGMLHGDLSANPLPNHPYRPWAVGWLTWDTSSHNTNVQYLTKTNYASLAPYLGFSASVFKCPEDTYVSRMQEAKRWASRVRTYVGSVAVGPGNAETGPFDGNYYQHIQKLSDLNLPGPRSTFVFTEEHPDSMNDPCLQLPQGNRWVDLPGSFHNAAANITFGDGHAEMHRWVTRDTLGPVRYSIFNAFPAIDQADLLWVKEHSPRYR